MSIRDMYRKLNWQGGTPREVSEVVNNLVEGKSNNTGEITLNAGGATSTTIYDERIGYNSFIQLMPITASAANAANISLPFGDFYDTNIQSAASTTVAYPVNFNQTSWSEGVSITSNSHIKVDYAGVYNLQFSLQLSSLANSTEDVDIWFRQNGNVNTIPVSNSRFGLAPRKSSSDPYHLIAALNFFVTLDANEYVEIMWRTSSTAVTIQTYTGLTSPTRPDVPSAIATVQYLSANNFSSNLFGGVYISSTSKGQAVITHPINTATDKTYRYLVVA